MKKIPQHLEELLQRYIDGTLSADEKVSLEDTLSRDPVIQVRFKELQEAHALLGRLSLHEPSKNFTSRVMANLHHYPTAAVHSLRNGLLLLGGIIFVMAMAVVLVTTGVFDTTTTIDFNQVGLVREYVDKNLPPFAVDGKVVVNVIIMLNLAIAFVVLDRAILKPFFQRRMHSGH